MAPEMESIDLGETKLHEIIVGKPDFNTVGEISFDADLTSKLQNDVHLFSFMKIRV